ncbi:hypothetical protein B0J11DRAFT_421357 [Dendryphion nanum]|uniref:Uncharacterized protein n=1 Tax=Dendryphion nanum TaxID=256645 RepID=A0A9P9IXI1_9PLEO|nr:hypothetical protein B0J11DRAFT_421357 [Dendryphion nanum]
MAHQTSSRPTFADMGGMHLQNHKVLHDTPSNVRYSDQRSPSDDTMHGSAQHSGGRGSGHSTSEEATNEDDDEDSSGNKEDDQEDDEEDAEALAPSHGLGKGKGLRPAIRIESAGEDESQDDDETTSREAGLKTSKHPVNQLLMGDKKRTYSNLSSTSLLFGDDDGPPTFPRPKMARRLSYNDDKGILTYHQNADDNAIETSDDEDKAIEDEYEDDEDDEDEDYSGVMNVIDDETDVENMEQEEEQFIVHDEQQHGIDLFSASLDFGRRDSIGSLGSEDILGFDMGGLMAYPEFDFMPPDPGFGHFFETEQAPPSPEPLAKRKFSDSSTKRVRFDDEVQVSDSSSSSSDELDSATFPDLFMEQDKLPPSIYQQLVEEDNDSDHADYTSDGSNHSYWDYGQDESRHLTNMNTEDYDGSSDPGSSGYETDMGDTTDEYDSDICDNGPPNPQTPRQRTVLRRPASAPSSRAPSPTPFRRGNVIPPPRGVFVHDDSRLAIAVTDSVTKKMTFYRPRASFSTRRATLGAYSSTSSTANNSPRTSAVQMNASDSEISNERFSNAWMGSDIMFAGLLGGTHIANGMIMGQNIGPPEAFYPFVNIENGHVISDEDEYDYDDEDFESDINLADFMDFGAESDETDVEADEETEVPATPATSVAAIYGSTPAQPTPMSDVPIHRQSDAMLEHFDRAGVTAFRNNQNRYHELARLPYDPSLRASVSKPVRSGRSAETLMSPLRKRSSSLKKPRNSTFAGVTKATSRLQSSVLDSQRGPLMGTFS